MSIIYIDKSAYEHNLQQLSKIATKDKLIVVLKDNAYGHGLKIMSKLAFDFGIKNIAVRNTKEALEIEESFTRIIILSEMKHFILKDNFEYVINSENIINKLEAKQKVHLKISTGMNRNGIDYSMVESSLKDIINNQFKLVGVMSHLHSSDEDNDTMYEQIDFFLDIKQKTIKILDEYNISDLPKFHICNSSALFRCSTLEEFDFVRAGIATYGYVYLPNYVPKPNLKPVLSLWAEKIASRKVSCGDVIGYGGTYNVLNEKVVSSYDIGYADGFYRNNINKTIELTNNQKVLGRVSMDSIVVNSNDEMVCIFDNAEKLANQFNTISYDVLVKLPNHINREIKE